MENKLYAKNIISYNNSILQETLDPSTERKITQKIIKLMPHLDFEVGNYEGFILPVSWKWILQISKNKAEFTKSELELLSTMTENELDSLRDDLENVILDQQSEDRAAVNHG